MLGGLKELDWPANVKQMQKHWIGKSEGMTIPFEIETSSDTIFSNEFPSHVEVFTTRPETIYGVTFLAISPTHPMVLYVLLTQRKTLK